MNGVNYWEMKGEFKLLLYSNPVVIRKLQLDLITRLGLKNTHQCVHSALQREYGVGFQNYEGISNCVSAVLPMELG